MRWIWMILLIGSILSLPSHASNEYLYLYGEPYYTPTTGLVRVSPSDFSAHPTAQGFATNTNLNLVTGLELNQDGTQGILFGNFQFWNQSYVGSVLQLNPQSLNVSTFGSGVLGQSISCATFISDTQIAIGGEFTGFTHAPQLQLTQIGICNNRGQNCYTLTPVPVKSGPKDLFYLGGYLYASFLPNVAPPSIQIWRYNFDSGNPNQEWVEILNQQADVRSVMTIFNGSIWLFGSMTIQNINYGAMQYEPNSNSWAAYNANPPYNLTNTELSVLVSVSPDDQTAFLSVVSDSFSIWKWNNPAKSWSNWTSVECPSFTTALSFASFTNGLIVPCNGTLMKLSEQNISDVGIVVVQQSLGYFYCKNSVLATTPDQNSIIAYCSQPDSGKFATYDISTAILQQCCGTLGDLSQLVVTMDAMCVYGTKVFLSGQFSAIDSIPSNYTMSVWYQQYQRWYSIDLPGNTSIASCYCDTDGDMMVAVCRSKNAEKNLPFMVIDHADNEVNQFTIVMLTDTQGYDKVSAVQIYDSQIFFAAGAARENSVAIFSWSEIFGSIPAIVADGETISSMLFVDEVLFMGGSLVTVGNKTVSLAAYNTSSNLFIDMDSIMVTASVRGIVHSLTYSPYTNLLYVSGEFSQAGPLRVQNIVGYSLNGTAVDNVGGGMPAEVTSIVSIDNGLFAVYLQDCPQSLDPNCGALVFYNFDEQLWSYTLALGAGYISQGPSIGDDSGKNEFQYIEKIVISSCVLLGVAIIALIVVWIVKRKKSKSGVQYKEIPASLEDPEIASARVSMDLIDFDNEPFDPQEVIGKGTFGTVWSCEFPQIGPALFAVKQILLSKGDVKKIETVAQELEILKKLRHPHIVNLLGSRKEISVTSVEFFLFMELYEYPASLKDVILMKKKHAESSGNYDWFSYAEVAKFLKQISEGLCYLHQQGIAHRDLKPSNILVRVEGKLNSVKSLHLSDFGLARAIEENNSKLAAAMISNSTCMAPEIFQHDNYDAFKADIWSFGIVLFEILTWEEPTTPGFRPSFPETQDNNNEFAQIVQIFNECTEADVKKRPTCDELYHLCSTL